MNWNILKKAVIGLIVSCVLVTSMPSFSIRSEAVGAGSAYIAYETAQAYLTYLYAYFGARGISSPKIAQDPDNTYVANSSPTVVENFVNSFIDKLKLANTAQTTALLYALERAKNSGVFSITAETDQFLKDYLESITVNSQLVLGSSTERFESQASGTGISLSFNYKDNNVINSPYYAWSMNTSIPYDYLPVMWPEFNEYNVLTEITIYYLPKTRISSWDSITSYLNQASVSISNTGSWSPDASFLRASFNSNNYYLYQHINTNSSRFPSTVTLPTILAILTNTVLQSIYENFILNGYYDSSLELVSDQLYDTSNTDVLSVASEVDPYTGVVTPGFTYYMKDLSLFQQLIQQFNQGILSWNSLIKSLGLSSVASDASVATKEAAMDKVAYPDSTYDWLASTTWGETLTQPVVEEARKYHADEVAKSDSIGELLAYQTGGDLPEEDKEKAYNSMLLGSLLMWLGIWRPPNLSGEDPDGGGIGPEDPDDPYGTSGYIADTVAGVSVASGLIDAAFNSAGGSNGFGIVFTLGATFVIFSVLIGAANYFGSKGDDVENNNSSSKPNKRPARSKQKSKAHKVKKAG